ncbi:hypothetical protein KBF38_22750 [bacterium]|nr:hypothetical protein [bacterium]
MKREADLQSRNTLVAAIQTELAGMRDWASEYSAQHDYATDGAVFLRWRAPFYKPIHPIVHNTIALAASAGLDRGLSVEQVKALLELEYQLSRFERARRQIDDVANNNLDVCSLLTDKLLEANPEANTINLPTLAAAESVAMRRFYELNRVLHVECIGDSTNSPNLHTAYNSVKQKFELDNAANPPESAWETRGHVLAVILVCFGIGIMFSAFVSFFVQTDMPPAPVAQNSNLPNIKAAENAQKMPSR